MINWNYDFSWIEINDTLIMDEWVIYAVHNWHEKLIMKEFVIASMTNCVWINEWMNSWCFIWIFNWLFLLRLILKDLTVNINLNLFQNHTTVEFFKTFVWFWKNFSNFWPLISKIHHSSLNCRKWINFSISHVIRVTKKQNIQ